MHDFPQSRPTEARLGLAYHQQAADELGGDQLGGAGEEGWREVMCKRGGYASGYGG